MDGSRKMEYAPRWQEDIELNNTVIYPSAITCEAILPAVGI